MRPPFSSLRLAAVVFVAPIAAVAAMSASAAAGIVPAPTAAERVLYRPGRALALAVGAATDSKGLRKAAAKGQTGLAIVGKPPGGKGLARLRLDTGGKGRIDVTLLVGGKRVEDGPETAYSGYGLRIRSNRIQVVRVSKGAVKYALASAKARVRRAGVVEVILHSLGGYLDAQVYAVGSGKHLASITVKAGPPLRTVGVLFGKRHPAAAVVTRVSARANCAGAKGSDVASGPTRYVHVPPGRADAAAARGRMTRLERIRRPKPAVVLQTDSLGVERLACAKIPFAVTIETPWKYVDASYRAHRRRRPKATATGFEVSRSYKNPRMVQRLLEAYAKRFPHQTALYEIGRSRERRPVFALAVTSDISAAAAKPAILLNAAHHGNEPMSTEFVFDALQYLLERPADPAVRPWLDALTIWIVPMVNPDGAYAFLETSKRTGRKNGRDLDRNGVRDLHDGVDLNRNYPFRWGFHGENGSKSNKKSVWYRGPKPASEPETVAMMALFESERFAASISYHVGTVAVLAPYTIPGVINPYPNAPWVIAEELVAGLPPHPQERVYEVRKNLYDVDGTDQDWFRWAHGTLALLVEGAKDSPVLASERTAIVAHGRPLWTRLLDRYVDGPTIEISVTDAAGRPVPAEIDFLEIPNHNGERWRARCRDGLFTHMLAAPGPLTVIASLPDRPVAVKRVEVERKRTRVAIALPYRADAGAPCPVVPGKQVLAPPKTAVVPAGKQND